MLKSAGITLIAKLVVALLNFSTIVLISRYLGPEERGVCSWYLVIIAISLVFSEMIAGPTVGFLTLKYQESQLRVLSYAWAIFTSLATTVVCITIGKLSSFEAFWIVAVCWLNAGNTIHQHLLLARQRFKTYNILVVLQPLVIVASLLLFFETGRLERQYFLWSLAIAWGIGFIAGLILLNKEEKLPQKQSYSFLVREGFRHGLSNQAGHLTSLLNNRLVFLLLPAQLLGVYSNALALAEATMMLPGSLGQVMYAKLLREGDESKSGRIAIVNWWITLFLLVFFAVAVYFIPDALYQSIFGASFIGIRHFLIYLSIAMIFYGGYQVFSYWQSSRGRFIFNFYASLMGLVVNATASGFLVYIKKYTVETGVLCLGLGFLVFFVVSCLQFADRQTKPNRIFWPLPAKKEILEMLRG